MILLRSFCVCALLVGLSCKKEDAATSNVVTVDLPERIEFSPSGQSPMPINAPSTQAAPKQAQVSPKSAQAVPPIPQLPIQKKDAEFDEAAKKPVFRDPFLSYLSGSSDEDMMQQGKAATLLDFDVKNYQYVGYILDRNIALALVQDPSGIGYTLKVGSKIGRNGGHIESIHPNQIVIKEVQQDVTGKGQIAYTKLKLGH